MKKDSEKNAYLVVLSGFLFTLVSTTITISSIFLVIDSAISEFLWMLYMFLMTVFTLKGIDRIFRIKN